jgi:hypothetical protein
MQPRDYGLSSLVPLGTRSSGDLAPRSRVRGEPDVGKKFIELNRGMGRQATEDIPEVREGIDVEVLAAAVEE